MSDFPRIGQIDQSVQTKKKAKKQKKAIPIKPFEVVTTPAPMQPAPTNKRAEKKPEHHHHVIVVHGEPVRIPQPEHPPIQQEMTAREARAMAAAERRRVSQRAPKITHHVGRLY